MPRCAPPAVLGPAIDSVYMDSRARPTLGSYSIIQRCQLGDYISIEMLSDRAKHDIDIRVGSISDFEHNQL
jgi:hypothetical protein